MKLLNLYNYGRKISLFCRDDEGKQVIIEDNDKYPYYYEPDAEGYDEAYDGPFLRKVSCRTPWDLSKEKSRESYQADLKWTKLYMIDNVDKIEQCPVKYSFIDIEVKCKDFPKATDPKYPISCISASNSFTDEVKTWYLGDYSDDKELIKAFIWWIKNEKPDIIFGWNVEFDYQYLYARWNYLTDECFASTISPIGRYRKKMTGLYPAGISIVDYLLWYKNVVKGLGQYTLDHVFEHEFKTGKEHAIEDFDVLNEELKQHNIEDVKRLVDVEKKYDLVGMYNHIRIMSKTEFEDLDWNCLDEESEILTKNGWKNYKTVKEDDEALGLNLFSKEYDYFPIEHIHTYHHEGKMYEYNGPRADYCVTGNHRFPMVNVHKGGKWQGVETLCFENANSIPEQRRAFVIGSKGYHKGKTDWYTDEEIELFGWIITEGGFEKRSGKNFGGAITISQLEVNPQNCRRIGEILTILNLPYTRTKKGFYITSNFTAKYRVLLKEDKRIPEELFDLPYNQLKILLDTCIKGDGSRNKTRAYICTADYKLAEDYQRLATLCGLNAYVNSRKKSVILGKKLKNEKTTYYTNIYYKEEARRLYRKHNESIVDYHGYIWCITTPHENFVMRRKGKIMISGNSRVIDQMVLMEAKEMGVVLPSKREMTESTKFAGAYRKAHKKGTFFNLKKVDLTAAYPSAMLNYCLDSTNIVDEKTDTSIAVEITDRDTREVVRTYYVEQDEDKLLPKVVKKLLKMKAEVKAQKESTNAQASNYKDIANKYDAIKAVVNSAYGIFGLPVFRLFDKRVAEMTTAIVRDLLHYCEDRMVEEGNEIVYADTDSLFIVSELSGEELTTRLNELIQEWSQDRFKKPCIIEFDYEGYFDRVLIVALCHYKGYIVNTRGEMKCETKGIAAKRSNSSVFVKDYQTILIEKILNKESEADVSEWVQGEMERIKTLPLADIATPCKLARLPEEYTKKYEKFVRALNNTKSLIKYHKRIGERYYHINIMPEVDDKGDWKLGIMDRKFDVLAFDKKCYDHIDRDKIDWYEVINTNIIKKTEHIYEVMDWDFVRIKPERGRRTKRLMLERKKLPENKQ